MKNIKYKIYSLGCKVNQYDAGKLSSDLLASGLCPADDGADLVIVHSCAVTSSAITKSRQTINKARKENPRAKVVLSGCWPSTYRQEAEGARGVDLVLAKASTKDLLSVVESLYGYNSSHAKESVLAGNSDRGGRYFLKIQDGCEQFCSYCVIPHARGPLTSRSSRDIIQEARAAISAGFSEIVLSGIHLGLYGVEHVKEDGGEKGMDLCKLIEQLSSLRGLKRIRLSSIEVTEVSKSLIALIKSDQKLCHHLHIPLQSGCDNTLRAMKRPYDTEFFAKKLKELFLAIPDISITSDVIVGFPGESAEDFKSTMSFLDGSGISRLHVFPFSAHPLTSAASMSGIIPDKDKKARALKLRTLSDRLEKNYRQRFLGQEMDVVVESFRAGKFKGRTGNYLEIEFSRREILSSNRGKKDLIGEVVKVRMR